VRGTRLEDGNVDLLVRRLARVFDLHFEVGLHVVDVDAVLVEQRARDALANALLVVLLDRLARDVVEDLAVLNRAGLVGRRAVLFGLRHRFGLRCC
jgi:hypothetical protein